MLTSNAILRVLSRACLCSTRFVSPVTSEIRSLDKIHAPFFTSAVDLTPASLVAYTAYFIMLYSLAYVTETVGKFVG
ncbi:hypothetical protein BDV12DRAFT_58947 [Aspergillus spectabilis]